MERTELEVLEYLNEKGVKAAPRRLKSFLKHNKLTNKDQVTATIADYSMFHENVRLGVDENGKVLLGQNRLYISDGEKESPTERVTGNFTNGRQVAGDVDLLKEYFFQQLVERVDDEGWSETMNEWGKKWVDMLPVAKEHRNKFNERLMDTFSSNEHLDEKIIGKISSNVLENLRFNRRGLAINFIEKLEAEGRIETEIEFYQAFAKDSVVVSMQMESGVERPVIHQIMDEGKHAHIVEGIEKVLEVFGVPYHRFKVVSAFNHLAKESIEKEAVEAVNVWLLEEYSIDYMYNRIRVWVLDTDSVQEISHEKARQAYIDRIIQLTNSRMNRKGYQVTHKYQNAFYRLSMFLLLNVLGVKGLENQIELDKATIDEIVDKCREQYVAKYGIPEVEIAWGFGDRTIKQQKRVEVIPFGDVGDMLIKEIEASEEVVNEVVNADLEWLGKFSKRKPVKCEISKEQQERVGQAARISLNNPNMIDIASIVEDEPVEEEKMNNSYNPFDDRASVLPVTEANDKNVEVDSRVTDEDYSFDLDTFHQHITKDKRIDITESIENTPPIKGFGWEIDDKKRVEEMEKEATERRRLPQVI